MQGQEDATTWVANWMRSKGAQQFNIEDNYFEKGIIDSLGVVSLIIDIEEKFGINLGIEMFLDPRFSTISGIAEIINEEVKKEAGKGTA